LDVTSIEAGQLPVQDDQFALSDYLKETEQKFAAPEKPVNLHWEIPDGLPQITTDRAKLTTILQHIISNAIKFTEKGDIWITAKMIRSQRQVEINVKDTGIGIPREARALIFEKFQQVDPSTTRSYGGMGLGLYIAKVFAGTIGAAITVDSEPNKGSTFTLSVPI